MAETRYLRLDQPASVPVKPTFILGATGAMAEYTMSNARMLSFSPKGGPQDLALATGLPTVNDAVTLQWIMAQFCTEPLAAQTVPATSYVVGLCATVSPMPTYYNVYHTIMLVDGSTGAFYGTVSSGFLGAANNRTTSGELTFLGTTFVPEFTNLEGDYLCLELAIHYYNNTGSSIVAPQVGIYTGGTTLITTDDVLSTSALSFTQFPMHFGLLHAGEAILTAQSTITAQGKVFRGQQALLFGQTAIRATARAMYIGKANLVSRTAVGATAVVQGIPAKATLVVQTRVGATVKLGASAFSSLFSRSSMSALATQNAKARLNASAKTLQRARVVHIGKAALNAMSTNRIHEIHFAKARMDAMSATTVKSARVVHIGPVPTDYSLVPLQMVNDNWVKKVEANHSAKAEIMPPRISWRPEPTPRPGYGPIYLPTWCDVGQKCDAVLCAVTKNQQGKYLPPRNRNPIIWDSTLARFS